MLALAGIAEAMIGMQIMVTWLGLFLIGGLSFLAFVTQQRWIHNSVLVLAILFGVMFVPWEIPFTPLTEKGREDPDVVTWHDRYLTLAYACYATMPLVIANFIQSVFRKPIPTTRTDVETLPADVK